MVITYKKSNDKFVIENNENINIYVNDSYQCLVIGNCLDDKYQMCDPKKILNLIKNGSFETENFHGIYSVIFYDGKDKIRFFNDRMNISRLYYYFDEEMLIISDKVNRIVEHLHKKLSLDLQAWAEFFCFYYVLGNRTFFKEIKSLYFGEIIELEKNEYSCAMKSHFRKSGNQMSGKWKSSYTSLLA